MKTDYEFCVLTGEKDIIEYEKGLYNAFSLDKWMMGNYNIKNDRMRSKISYKDQKIYAFKKNNKIIAAIAGHLNMNTKLQLEDLGFSIDKQEGKICEGLTFYISENLGEEALAILGRFMDLIIDALKKLDVNIIYTTCSEHLLNLYKLFGFEIIDKKEIYEVDEYLIKYIIE